MRMQTTLCGCSAMKQAHTKSFIK